MADEYIKREDALTELDEIGFCDDEPIQTRNNALKIIQNIPAADVAPVRHGRWIVERDDYFGFKSVEIKCSECNSHPKDDEMTSFCPNCGAQMDADMREDG